MNKQIHTINKMLKCQGIKSIISQVKLPLCVGKSRGFAQAEGINTTNPKIERTALYEFHVKHGGKMVNFGGFSLPVQYTDQSLTASHLHTRKASSIFDVSHMLQTYVYGKDALSTIESICTADIRGLAVGSGTLTVFTNATGGILDDLIVTKVNDETLYIVSNAAMKTQDMELMSASVSKYKADKKSVEIEFLTPSHQSLIALQGPKSAEILSKIVSKDINLSQLYFMNTTTGTVANVARCRITRCGYTGEDGFEISVRSEHIAEVCDALLNASEDVKLAGLGARDSLRLEAGLCLYGTDLNSQTSPIEGGLAWLVAKRRREELNFPGAAVICNHLKNGVSRKRVGMHLLQGNSPPARAHTEIFYESKLVGEVTSGCPSPSLNKNIAMGYIKESLQKPGAMLQLKIRNKFYEAEVIRMPFVKSNYYNIPK